MLSQNVILILLTYFLLIANTFGVTNATCENCDKSLLPELTFLLGGNNLLWPCESTKNIYVTSGRYAPRNVIITRAQILRDEAFVAMPRFKRGVPFTLGKISLKKGECLTPVAPYPCWPIQEEGNCQALQNVVDILLDPHGILWVLDTGIVNTLEQPIRRCNPKIVAINTANGKVVKNVDLSGLVTAASRLQYLLADYDLTGKPYAFVADAGTGSIIVLDVLAGKSYRVVLPPEILSNCNVAADVLYIAIAIKSCGTKVLYVTFLSSPRLYSIKVEYLLRGLGAGAVVDEGPKPNGKQIVILGTDNGNSLFLRYKGESDIYMWNTETCFKAANLVEVQRGGDCRLATQVLPGHKKFMWALESNFHDFIENTCGCNGPSIALHPVVRECDD